MAGLFGLSVDPIRCRDVFSEDLFRGIFYQQNRGEKYAGLAVLNNGQMNVQSRRGLFRSSFWPNKSEFDGQAGIGYCGLAPEPLSAMSKFGDWAVCFSGNVLNSADISQRLKDQGDVFSTGEDIEVVAKLIARGHDIIDGIRIATKEIKGAFSLLLLTGGGIYAAVCPSGRWPLVIGEKEGAVAIASESGGFSNIGFRITADLQPGEIVYIENGKWGQKGVVATNGREQICSFLWVYTSRPEARVAGVSASQVRKRLGAALAERDIARGFIPHVVVSVPDSGRSHAIGYHQAFCRALMQGRIQKIPFFDELLLRFPYSGRSFTRSTQEKRDREADLKIVRSGETAGELLEAFEGLGIWDGDLLELRIVVCEDSVVRGTQLQQKLIPRLREIGVKVYIRASNPPILAYCPWGKTTQQSELLAQRFPLMADRIQHLKVDGLEYNIVEDLVRAIGLPRERLCLDCSLPPR